MQFLKKLAISHFTNQFTMSRWPRTQLSILFHVIILLHACFVRVSSFPHNSANNASDANDGDMEIITVEEIVRGSSANLAKNTSAALITANNEAKTSSKTSSARNVASHEPMIDTADDLIFLAEGPQQSDYSEEASNRQRQQQQQQQQQQRTSASTVGTFQQIDLLTSAEEDSLTAIATAAASKSSEAEVSDGGNGSGGVSASEATATTAPIKHVAADNSTGIVEVEDDDDGDGDGDEGDVDAVSLDDDDDDAIDVSTSRAVSPIDMSDFVALIPVGAVKSIAANYYRNDPEVQRAYAYLSGPEFAAVRQNIVALQEVQLFLRYLNNSGLDVVGFLCTLTNLTRKPDELLVEDNSADDVGSGSDAVVANEIENGLKANQLSTTSAHQSATTTEEPVKGLHGLVDSVLELLPQDQILGTFFDKLESNEQFTRLVENIGQPAFARILHNLQNSASLRTYVFMLHNHGIYITRIIDSLKAYFFLGTF